MFVWGWYAQFSVMQADRVLDIVTESWHDNRLVSAAEARRASARVRVSRPPEAEKLSWTQAAETTKWLTYIHKYIHSNVGVNVEGLHKHWLFYLQLLATVIAMKEHMGWKISVGGSAICWSHTFITGKAATQIRWPSSGRQKKQLQI